MSTPSPKPIGVGIIPVPDGVNDDGSLRLCLLVAPNERSAVKLDLVSWPAEVAALCGKQALGLRVEFCDELGTPLPAPSVRVSLHRAMTMRAVGDAAARAWRKLFPATAIDDQLELLYRALIAPPRPESKVAVKEMLSVRHYQAGPLSALFGHLRGGSVGQTLRARMLASEHGRAWKENPGIALKGVQAAAFDNFQRPFLFTFERHLQNAVAQSFRMQEWTTPLKSVAPFRMAEVDRQIQQERMANVLWELRYQGRPPAGGLATTVKNLTTTSAADRDAMLDSLLLRVPYRRPNAVTMFGGGSAVKPRSIAEILQLNLAMHEMSFSASFSAARGAYAETLDTPSGKLALINEIIDARSEAVQTKFNGLRAHPVLAKLLNMMVDTKLTLTTESARPPTHGYLRLWFDKETAPVVVAYVIEYDEKGKPLQFRPGARAEFPDAKTARAAQYLGLPLAEGVVKLDPNRFMLSSCDIHSIVNATKVKMNELASAHQAGSSSDPSARLVEERGRGIQLFDNEGHRGILANMVMNQVEDEGAAIYAETLVTGYRVFVKRRPLRPDKGSKPEWRTLMARAVTYPGLIDDEYRAQRGETGPAWRPYEEAGEREHGIMRPLPRREVKDDGTPQTVAPSHVFSWLGDSLGMPMWQPEGDNLSCEDSQLEHLQIGFSKVYRYAKGRQYLMPPLRVGSGYQIGLAPVYLHGGGPTLQQAAKAFDTAKRKHLVLGGQGDEPFLYGRPADVQAPVVLLAESDPLIVKTALARNEHADRVVLRSGVSEDTGRVVRYLAPPRVEFHVAEQYGIFDADNDAVPAGAFQDFDMNRSNGDFCSIERPVPGGEPAQFHVLRSRRSQRDSEHRYYVDPAARNLGLIFARQDALAPDYPDLLPPLSFWQSGREGDYHASRDARPVKLVFKRWAEARSGGRVTHEETSAWASGGPALQTLTIELAPAEEATLWTWCWPDLATMVRARPYARWPLARGFVLSETALANRWRAEVAMKLHAGSVGGAALAKEASSQPDGEGRADVDQSAIASLNQCLLDWAGQAGANTKDIVDGLDPALKLEVMRTIEYMLFRQLPLNGLTGWHRIELVHAVDKPLATPAIVRQANLALDFHVTRVRPGGSASQGHQIGGTKMLFAGSVRLDRASTRALRVEASWPRVEHKYAVLNQSKVEGKPHYVDKPPRIDQLLFEIADIPREGGANGDDVLNLLTDELGRMRQLHSESDTSGNSATAACVLNLRLVATSRFSDYFAQELPDRPASQLGKFEVASRPSHSGPAMPALDGEYEIVVPATVRPPPPVVTAIEWLAPERRRRVGTDHLLISKHYLPRIYLDDSYRVSGPDELIGIAFLPAGTIKDAWPPVPVDKTELIREPFGAPTRMLNGISDEYARFAAKPGTGSKGWLPFDYCEYAPDSAFCDSPTTVDMQFVTRWGHDATTGSMGKMEALISATRFSGHCAAMSKVAMPLPDTQASDDGRQPSIAVGVVLYRPQLDATTGQWYIDVAIDPGAVHAPWVRLALTRYQPHALQKENDYDLRMSQPLLLDPFQVPAPRTVEVRHAKGRPIEASVYGVGYRRREPYGVSDRVRHLTDMPLLNIELKRRGKGSAAALLQSYRHDGTALRHECVQPNFSGPLLCWQGQFMPPQTDDLQNYALVFDEIEMHIPDSVLDAGPAVRKGKTEPLNCCPDDLVQRPSYFSLTVDLDD